ncbi:MAG: NUDIX hydrolase [Actinomycetes bacterium]
MTLSESAHTMLDDWEPSDTDQDQLRKDFLHHLRTAEDAWSRHCLPDHLTASALVVDQSRTKVLLALHRKVGIWLQFGGHIEPDDRTVAEAALREAFEESGLPHITLVSSRPLRLDRHAAPCGSGARHHLDIQFLALASSEVQPQASPESEAVRWFPVNDLPQQTDDALRHLVTAACDA